MNKNHFKSNNHLVAMLLALLLPFIGLSHNNGSTPNTPINYSIIPKLPPAPKAEPFFWEQKDPSTVKSGELTGRLRFIKFTSRKPTKPLPVVFPDLKWATDLKDFKWTTSTYPEQGVLKAKVSGYAEISMTKPEQGSADEPRRVIKYVDFTDDGE